MTAKVPQRLVVAPEQIHQTRLRLTEAQQHYLTRVLRLGSGDRFIAMDGQGHSWLAVLERSESAVVGNLLEPLTVASELPIAVTLVAALPKGSGFDDVVRQATELGVTEIIPVLSDRTLLQPSPQKVERWRRIAQEAAEQSERQMVPTITEPIAFKQHLQTLNPSAGLNLLAVTRWEAPHLLTVLQSPFSTLTVAIGPEGGWTDAEVSAAISAGYQPISLGARILRSVTAPLVALAIVAAHVEKTR